MAITNLSNHTSPYVTIRELAEYWRVSQKQIRRRLAEGRLIGLRLGPRICRISVASARAFERGSEQALSSPSPSPAVGTKPARRTLVEASRRTD